MKLRTITAAICLSMAFPLAALPDSKSDAAAAKTTEIKSASPGKENENISVKANAIAEPSENIGSTPAKNTAETPKGQRPFGKFYIFTDDETKNHFYPSGWMGDSEDIKVSAAYLDDKPELGKTCMRVTYLARGKKEWAGIFWQHPAGNWGTKNGGFNLNGAKYITFWAKGEKGGEKISEFKMGGLSGKYPDSDTAWLGPVKLKKEWAQYKIDLKGKDLRYISGGFCFTVLATDSPSGCTFYMADVKYE
jgi:hypothetical protein